MFDLARYSAYISPIRDLWVTLESIIYYSARHWPWVTLEPGIYHCAVPTEPVAGLMNPSHRYWTCLFLLSAGCVRKFYLRCQVCLLAMWLSSYLRYATLTAPGIYYKQNGDSKELSHFRSCTTWLVYALRGLAAPLNYQVTETISGHCICWPRSGDYGCRLAEYSPPT